MRTAGLKAGFRRAHGFAGAAAAGLRVYGSPAGWLSVATPPLCPSILHRDFQRLEMFGFELFQQLEADELSNPKT